jgi:hypothetical protein
LLETVMSAIVVFACAQSVHETGASGPMGSRSESESDFRAGPADKKRTTMGPLQFGL